MLDKENKNYSYKLVIIRFLYVSAGFQNESAN